MSPARSGNGEILRPGGAASAFVRVVETPAGLAVRKDFSRSSALVRFTVGALMARREARAYARLEGVAGVPRLLARPAADALLLERIEGVPCVAPVAAGVTQAFFDDLDALLVRLRSRGVLHGDVKRNVLVTPAGAQSSSTSGPRSSSLPGPARSDDGSWPSPPATTNARSPA